METSTLSPASIITSSTEPTTTLNQKKVFILGGYGNTGKLIAKHLLQETSDSKIAYNLQVVIAGRNLNRAQNMATELGPRATACQCDASDPQLVDSTCMKDVDLLVVASPTSKHVENVVRACFQHRIDYMDIQMSNKHKVDYLSSRKQDIQDEKLCFVTDGGFHPGLPAALIRYAAAKPFTSSPIPPENITSAKGYCNLSMDFNSITDATDAMYEGFLEDICSMELRLYGGDPPAWKTCSWMTPPVSFDFGPPFGTKQCIPMYLEELNEVASTTPTIQEMGFIWQASIGSRTWWFCHCVCFHWESLVSVHSTLCPFCLLPACVDSPNHPTGPPYHCWQNTLQKVWMSNVHRRRPQNTQLHHLPRSNFVEPRFRMWMLMSSRPFQPWHVFSNC